MIDIYYIPTDECKYWRLNMDPHKEQFYKMILNSMRKHGIINPLMGVKEGGYVRVRIGNTRLKAAKELGITTVPMILLKNSEEWKKSFDEYSAVPVG